MLLIKKVLFFLFASNLLFAKPQPMENFNIIEGKYYEVKSGKKYTGEVLYIDTRIPERFLAVVREGEIISYTSVKNNQTITTEIRKGHQYTKYKDFDSIKIEGNMIDNKRTGIWKETEEESTNIFTYNDGILNGKADFLKKSKEHRESWYNNGVIDGVTKYYKGIAVKEILIYRDGVKE